MMTKKNGRRKKFSKMGKASAAKLGEAGRELRARHAALTRHGMSERERRKDEREARQTIADVHAEMMWQAKKLVEKNPDTPVGTLAVDLQRAFRFYLSVPAAKALIERAAYLLAQGVVIPNPNPNPRFIATHCILTPIEPHPVQLVIDGKPVCKQCGSAEHVIETFIGPWDEPGRHNYGDVISNQETYYSHWCTACDVGAGSVLEFGSGRRKEAR